MSRLLHGYFKGNVPPLVDRLQLDVTPKEQHGDLTSDFGPVFSPFWGSITGGLAHPAVWPPDPIQQCAKLLVSASLQNLQGFGATNFHRVPWRERRFRRPRFLYICLTPETATKRCPIFWVNQLRLPTETAVSPKSKQMWIFSNTNMTSFVVADCSYLLCVTHA